MLKAKDILLKATRGKQLVPLWNIKLTADFSSKTMEARALKEKSGKDTKVLTVGERKSQNIHLERVFVGSRNPPAKRGRTQNYPRKVVLRENMKRILISGVKRYYLKPTFSLQSIFFQSLIDVI